MGYMKRPETPNISQSNKALEIAYNGVRISFRKSSKGNAIYEGMNAIDETLEGRLVEVDFKIRGPDHETRKAEEKRLYRPRNMALPEDRRELMDLVMQYATWFTIGAAQTLNDLLKEHSTEDSRKKRKSEPAPARAGSLTKQYLEQERKEFCSVWRLVFRDNITPYEAALKLGYDPREYS